MRDCLRVVEIGQLMCDPVLWYSHYPLTSILDVTSSGSIGGSQPSLRMRRCGHIALHSRALDRDEAATSHGYIPNEAVEDRENAAVPAEGEGTRRDRLPLPTYPSYQDC